MAGAEVSGIVDALERYNEVSDEFLVTAVKWSKYNAPAFFRLEAIQQ
jgi:hypothetical protein